MILREKDLDDIFRFFEGEAKNPASSDADISANLISFLEAAGYDRTSYELHFDGLYRARSAKFDSIESACSEFSHISKLSYPPAQYSRLCRCNADYSSVFYCSPDSGVPIFEVRPEVDSYTALTFFKPKRASRLTLELPIIGVKQIRESLLSRGSDNKITTILADDMQYSSEDNLSLQIDSRLAKWFVEPVNESNKHIYRLTTAFYNGLVSSVRLGDSRINALVYPSVESEVTGFNLVMQTDVVDDQLMITRSVIYHLEKKSGKTYFLRPKMETDSIDDNGDIRWKKAGMAHAMLMLNPSDLSPTF